MTGVKAINHIGIAVRSIDDQRSFYEGTLGAEFEGIEDVANQKVRVAFFQIGDVRLELLEPTDPTEPRGDVPGEARRRTAPRRLHRRAIFKDRIAELKESGLRMIDETPRIGAHHMQIAFVHPKSTFGVLTELCEPPADKIKDRYRCSAREFTLRDDFPPVDYDEWRALAEADLDGASFEQKLVTHTYEGIDIQPVYTRSDWPGEGDPNGFPGLPPFVRGSQAARGRAQTGWDLRQEHAHPDLAVTNQAILDDLPGRRDLAAAAARHRRPQRPGPRRPSG